MYFSAFPLHFGFFCQVLVGHTPKPRSNHSLYSGAITLASPKIILVGSSSKTVGQDVRGNLELDDQNNDNDIVHVNVDHVMKDVLAYLNSNDGNIIPNSDK